MLTHYAASVSPFQNNPTHADEELPKYQAHIKDQGVSERCQAMAISDLAACYVDRSFSIKHGCCSQKCSQGVRKVSPSTH